jgi:ribosomal protein S18 acetylase RimI-like enzyme
VASFATSGQGLAAALAWLGTVEFSLDCVGVEGSAWLGNHPEALSATARFTAWPSTLATVRTTGPKARRTMEQAMHVVKLSASSSHVLVAEQQGQLMGVLNAAQWPRCQMGAWERLKTAPAMLRVMGSAPPRASTMMSARARHDPHRPHWHIGPIGVHAEHQGRGVGKALLGWFLDLVTSRIRPASSRPMSTETSGCTSSSDSP